MSRTCRSITIGGVPKLELLARLRTAGVELNPIGLDLFAADSFRTLDTARVVETVQTTPAELGLRDGGTFAAIVQAASAHGLTLSELELGPHLRLALLDQPEGALGHEVTRHRAPPGSITVPSPPHDEHGRECRGFYLRRIDGVLCLRGFQASPDHRWQPDDAIVLLAAQGIAPPARPSRATPQHPETH